MRRRGEVNLESACSIMAMLSLLFAIAGLVCLGIDMWDRHRGDSALLVDTAMQERGVTLLIFGVSSFAGFALISWLLFKHATRYRKR